jgi:cytoskeletal protein RodZ
MGMKPMGGSWLKILGVAIGVATAAAVIALAVRRGKLSVQEKVLEDEQEKVQENQTKAAMALEKETKKNVQLNARLTLYVVVVVVFVVISILAILAMLRKAAKRPPIQQETHDASTNVGDDLPQQEEEVDSVRGTTPTP